MAKVNRKSIITCLLLTLLASMVVSVCAAGIVKQKNQFQLAAENQNINIHEMDTGHDLSYTPLDGTYTAAVNASDTAEYNDKVSIYSKMLNSIDNYNSLRLVFDTTMIGDTELTIECQTNIDKGMSYQAVYSGNELLRETSADGSKVSSLNHETKAYDADSRNVISRTDAYEIALSERITTGEDGLPRYYYRQNATNCSYASYAMFPQEIAFSYLKDFELWEISGTEEYLGRTCVVIEGIPCDYIGEKHNIDSFVIYVDSDTGVLLKLIGIKDNIEVPYITVTECSYGEFNVYQEMLNEVNLEEYTG